MCRLSPHILLFQIPDTTSGEYQEENTQANQKRDQILPERILGFVGVHAKQHYGIRPVHAQSFIT